MRIKRVVIQGFKTFARQTEFIFDPGVTAVVGPNGSGKSNIVDAVRWCLGEQSFSLLRSKKTADIIFSGSDKKARLGMAEVSLTLDNGANEIPIDFEEVVITRRAYRDGDNEYLVNGQRVRLQDITDLLSHTGLGKRTYSVVGQGLIDRALSMAPEERRSLFEEAAGITSYQMKRGAAMRRLEATHQNLTRVHDIVAELSPRLGYLRRQADRAREREQIAGDLKALLRDWYGYRWHAALRQLEDHHAAERELKQAVDQRQMALTAVADRIETLRLRQGELRDRLANFHGVGSGLHQEAERLGRELAVSQERLRQILARSADAEREVTPLQAHHATLTARIADLQEAVEQARAEYLQRHQTVETVTQEVGQRQQERLRLQNTLESARQEHQLVLDRRSETASRITQMQERRTVVQAEAAQQTTALTATVREREVAGTELAAAEQQVVAVEEEVQRIRQHVGDSEAEIAALTHALQEAEKTRQAADRVLDRHKTRSDLLTRLRTEGAGYGSGVRTVLQAASEDKLEGMLGTVASLLRVPAHLDKAVETALGGALQNIVASQWDHAAAAIEYLKQQRAGRATFLPLDRLNVLPAIPAANTAGILGNALDLVGYDGRVRPAVEQLLNRVWVAQDLDAARTALDQIGGGPRPTVVTLDGDIVRPGGAVSGGSDGRRGDDSLLARERELRELPDQINEATAAVDQAANRCRELTEQLEAVRLQVAKHQETLGDRTHLERQLRQRLEELRRRVDRSIQTHRWQEERLTQTQAELSTLDQREEEHDRTLSSLEEEQAQTRLAVENAEHRLAALGADELLQELANLRALAAETQGHLRSQEALLESVGRNLQSVGDQIEHKKRQIGELEGSSAELSEQIAVLTTQETGLSEQIDGLQAKIHPLEAEVAQLEQRQGEEEHLERQLQQALRRDESAWNTAQLNFQRSEDVLHQLRTEIEQDLGLVTLEQSDDVAYQPPLPWDEYVQQLAVLESVPDGLEDEVREMRRRLSRLGNVNPEAPHEYEEAAGRHEFLLTQSEDLEAAANDLHKIIKELDERMDTALRATFEAVAKEFTYFFQKLFKGGTAHLELSDPANIGSSGIEIIARPPGKRPQSLALLSGGERALSACALIFAILRVSPTPFCVLDEVDAALDEANIDRFRGTLEELSTETQFIIVTHNRRTLEGANTIYGVTMGNDGVSKVMSLRLEGDRIVRGESGEGGVAGDDEVPPEIEEVVEM